MFIPSSGIPGVLKIENKKALIDGFIVCILILSIIGVSMLVMLITNKFEISFTFFFILTILTIYKLKKTKENSFRKFYEWKLGFIYGVCFSILLYLFIFAKMVLK